MMACTKNAPRPYKTGKVDIAGYFKNLPGFLKTERDYSRMMAVQFLFLAASMCSPFIILFSGETLGMSQSSTALLILIQSVGAPLGGWLWGMLCDKIGSHNGIRVAGVNIILPPAISLLSLLFTGIPHMFFMIPVLFLIGVCGGTWTCYYVYTLHSVKPESRPACIVLTSIITLPTSFASYAAGYLSEKFGFVVLFVLCIVLAAAGMILSMKLRPAHPE
jgi:predicted MFS family arabinose efflux permease